MGPEMQYGRRRYTVMWEGCHRPKRLPQQPPRAGISESEGGPEFTVDDSTHITCSAFGECYVAKARASPTTSVSPWERTL